MKIILIGEINITSGFMENVNKVTKFKDRIAEVPETFTRKYFDLFADIPGVQIYFDDLNIQSMTEKEHDRALKQVLEKAIQNNVKFNFEKLQYKLGKVVFVGHIISQTEVELDPENIKTINAIESPKIILKY